jgi:hypothetical protein
MACGGPFSREKIRRKNRNTFSASRKTDAAGSGEVGGAPEALEADHGQSAKITRPSTE